MNSYRSDVNPCNFKSLTKSRVEFDVIFINKIWNDDISAQDLLSKLSRAVPYFYSRYPKMFKTKFHAINYGNAVPIDRAYRYLNNLSKIDIFYDSLSSIIIRDKLKNCNN